jgi:hypothetical protein
VGTTTICQDDRKIALRYGDITLVDTRRPYIACYTEVWNRLFFKIPFQALDSRLHIGTELTARVLSPKHDLGRLTSGYVQMLPQTTEALTLTAKEQLAEQLLDLVALTLAAQTDNKAREIAGANAIALLRLPYQLIPTDGSLTARSGAHSGNHAASTDLAQSKQGRARLFL